MLTSEVSVHTGAARRRARRAVRRLTAVGAQPAASSLLTASSPGRGCRLPALVWAATCASRPAASVIASVRGGKTERLILGTDTAAAGPYRAGHAPARLSEIPTPPTPLTLPGARRSAAIPARAAAAAAAGQHAALRRPRRLPGLLDLRGGQGTEAPEIHAGAANLLISYDNYCVTGNADELTAEGFGLIEYDPAGNLLSSPAVVFGSGPGLPLPPQQVLGSPVFTGDGYLYLFGFCPAGPPPAGCGRGSVFGVRTVAQPSYWRNPLTYQYWTGDGWSPDEAAARTLIPAGHPFGISVGDYAADGHGLVMVEQTSLAGGFQVWQARSPAGPWRRIITGRGAVQPGHPARDGGPVPRRHRPSGTQHPRPAAHLVFRSGKQSRGCVRLSLVIAR